MVHSLLPVVALALSANAAHVTKRRVAPRSSSFIATGPAAPTVLPPAPYVLPLAGKGPKASYKKAALRTLLGDNNNKKHTAAVPTAVLAGSDFDEEYLTNVTIGGQTFALIVDTGSSDTWVIEKGFSCFNLTGSPETEATCNFGPVYSPKTSKTFSAVSNKTFNIEYADLEYLYGTVALETVTAGGLTVTKQEIGVVNQAAWEGDGINSGLMGLAYPGLTSVYNGTDPTTASSNTSSPYNPFFFTAVAEGEVNNTYFSVALNRGTYAAQENSEYDPNLGYIAFGGIAPVAVTSTSVTVPVQGYAVSPIQSTTGTEYFFYTVDVQSYTFPGSNKIFTANNNTILDTGTTLNYVPTDVAKAYNAAFHPPAEFVEDEDTYYVDCKAKVPAFSVKIGGKSFSIDARDQILPVGTDDSGKEICISGTQDGGAATDDNIFVMGDVFLHNVVATFNIKTEKITLSERKTY